jgi:hypothetical protein
VGRRFKHLQCLIFCLTLYGSAFGCLNFASAAASFSNANWLSTGWLPGANGIVRAATTDDSGNLYIGGDFTVVGNAAANHVAKWNGSTWSAVGDGMNGSVYALAVYGSNVYAAGLSLWRVAPPII